MGKKEKILLRVAKGCLLPADLYAEEKLRSRNYHMGDILSANLSKPRNPGFHRMVHALGQLLVRNVEAFSRLNAHEALKKIQIEGRIKCDCIPILIQGENVEYLIPQSLSYESMDQVEFSEAYNAMCDYIAETYWPDLSAEKIQEMSELMNS